MGVTIRQAAVSFGVSHQTIRNWIKHPLLSEFFTPNARRDDGKGYAELFGEDLEVCNSIQTLLARNLEWKDVAAELAKGWRNKDLPPHVLLTLPVDTVESTAYALIGRASAEQKSTDLLTVLKEKDERIAALEARLEQKDADHQKERDRLMQELEKERIERAATETRMAVELELWRAGRLTTKGEG